MKDLHISTKQYYKIRTRSGDNPHWYDERGEAWSVKTAKQKKQEVLKKLSDRENLEVKIVIRTEITNTLDVDLEKL